VVANHAAVQRSKLKVDTLKCVMAKLAPRQYGEKPVDDVPAEEPITRITWTIIYPEPRPDDSDPAEPRQIA
jgi:hypothetical protein